MREFLTVSLIAILTSVGPCADLNINISALPDSMGMGDSLNLSIMVESPRGGELLLPDLEEIIGPFELLGEPQISRVDTLDLSLLKMDIPAVCYETGQQTFPSVGVSWRSSDGAEVDSASTEPFSLYVKGVLPDSIVTALDTVAKPVSLLQPNHERKVGYSAAEFLPWVTLALAGVGLIFLTKWWLRKRRKTTSEGEADQPNIPAHLIALEQLDKLKKRELYQSGQIKLYYSELTEIVRRYLETLYRVPALESTSLQLLKDLEVHLKNGELLTLLETMLTDADLAKFAKHRPEEGICQRDLENAYLFVDKTQINLQPDETEETA